MGQKKSERRGVRLSNAPAAMQLRTKTLPQCGTTPNSHKSHGKRLVSLSYSPLPATPAPQHTHTHILLRVGGWEDRERKRRELPPATCWRYVEPKLLHQHHTRRKNWEKVKEEKVGGKKRW
jgi:hypothetical protein